MLAAIIMLGVAPWAEEVLFRRGLHAWLLNAGFAHRPGWRHAPKVGVALLFGAAHAALRDPLLGAAVMLPALAIGWVYERSGSVAGCVAVHTMFNALWLGLWQLAGPGV